MNDLMQWISSEWGISESTQWKLIYTLITFFLILGLRILTIKVITRNFTRLQDNYYWTRAIKYIYGALFFLTVLVIWLSEVRSLATFFGLISAGITIALKDLIINAAGWIFIAVRKPFGIGDRISIGKHTGDVIDVRIFQFTINEIGNWVDADQSTGRIIHIPNGLVFTEPQANYTQGFSHIWNEICVLVTFESDWEKAKLILLEIVTKHSAHLTKAAEQKLIEASKQFMILYSKLTPIVYTSVKDSGVMLSMRYLITPRRRRTSEQSIWEDVLKEFAKHDNIDFAYPTQRIYYNQNASTEQPINKNRS